MATLQVAISFDTTGSMSAAIGEVRKRITEMIHFLKEDIPGVTLAIIAHGDYCDKDIYVTKHIDFTDDETALADFVRDVKNTHGGDAPECYELVLRLVRTKLAWKRKSQKILVVIGDAYPHPADDPQNKEKIDWEQEARLLAGMPMRIYGAQIKDDRQSTEFFRKLTQITGGSHLKLTDFSVLTDTVMAVCYRTKGIASLKGMEEKVRARYAPKPLHKELEAVFAVLHEPLAVPTEPSARRKPKPSPFVFRGKDVAFVWGSKLTPESAISWKVPEDTEEDEDEDTVHKLQLKLAVLGAEARAHEANVVEVETSGFSGDALVLPIVHMVGAKDSMVTLDLSFNSQVTFRLVSGSGPIYLSGQHVARQLPPEEEEEGRPGAVSITEVSTDNPCRIAEDNDDFGSCSEGDTKEEDGSEEICSEKEEEPESASTPEPPHASTSTGASPREATRDGAGDSNEDRSDVFERNLRSAFSEQSRLFGLRYGEDDDRPAPQCKTS